MHHRIFDLDRPARQTTAVVFASPHSGNEYPIDLMERTILDAHTIRSSEDAYVHDLFSSAPDQGASFLSARFPRAYLDLNRSRDELDPALIEGVRRRYNSPRIASGLGVIPRVVSNGRAIYRGKMTQDAAQERIERCWVPYHQALRGLMDDTSASFGRAILIDCHSMPHEAVDNLVRSDLPRPQVVLGDRFGASADLAIVTHLESLFRAEGLVVTRNSPFAGAYTVQHYGRPGRNQHAIQIEIDRSLYMNEATITPHEGYEDFKALIGRVIAGMAEFARATPTRMAAE
ncbi:MAG: N-formylglutamate amidohydrolase [Donghicola eburneus]|nr:N-formylglutamate amidohydrolase [Donghicola eburneus]MCI5038752.1 N-formylglutamate amidohydrolase [Donghicola eburneus]